MAVSVRKRSASDLLRANCLATDEEQDVVRVTGPAVGGLAQVTKLDINNSTAYVALGVIISKPSATECVVQVGGRMEGVYSGLTPGEPLFVGEDSKLTHLVPTHPAAGVRSVYYAAIAVSADVLLLGFRTPSKIVA